MTSHRSAASRLWLVGLMPLLPQVLGSAFNIWYNTAAVVPQLTAGQQERFHQTVLVFNLIIFPLGLAAWAWLVLRLRRPLKALLRGDGPKDEALERARREVINLPWWGSLIAGGAWLACLPVFLPAMGLTTDPLNPHVWVHLPISFIVSASIATTQSFFLVELATQRVLFPVFFRDGRADNVPGTWALSLRGRGWLWIISVGVCPVSAMLLIIFAPDDPGTNKALFSLFVGGVGMGFGFWTAYMLDQLVAEPVAQLRRSVQAVAEGNYDVRIDTIRADELGVLIYENNQMVRQLREKQRLQETFGLHVGREAARQILADDPGLSGTERDISVMFVDIRNFTARSADRPPAEVVAMLNTFLTEMVTVIESEHGGMINKFLGDGFMALFGATGTANDTNSHADAAVAAGRGLQARLVRVNRVLAAEGQAELAIGIGVHSGPAVVGSIGSEQRLEFTAIGSTVNLASRVEGLTKSLGVPMLITEATKVRLREKPPLHEQPAQHVKGMEEPVPVWSVGAAAEEPHSSR
ncbi:MAG: adenylate/guanylate cyclase domain-containing protein [Verrucomicrobiota bacterium]